MFIYYLTAEGFKPFKPFDPLLNPPRECGGRRDTEAPTTETSETI
jgi:hypothetical protein